MARSSLSQERLHEAFCYDEKTGALVWKISTSRRVKIGSEAGVIATNGRRYIGIDGQRHPAHRIVWCHVKGFWPEWNIAPINGDYLDTRIENLIEETPTETARKGGLRRAAVGASGVPGISWDTGRNKWSVHTTIDYKTVGHGRRDTLEEAKILLAEVHHTYGNPRVSEAERKLLADTAAIKARQRALWNNTLKNSGNVTGWVSFDDFSNDVGSPPKLHYIAAVNSEIVIGPGNFEWVKRAKFDHTTKEGRKAYGQKHRAEFPMKYREYSLKNTFGISLADYQTKLTEQDGKCAICRNAETARRGRKDMWFSVDHNHTTGAVRGLLCGRCNVAIGMFDENPETLKSAIAYLDR